MIEPFVKQDHLKKAIDPLTLSPAIYLDADTLNLSHGGQVLKWHDLSGNGRHYVGVTATAPTIANGFNNARNSVHFNATTRLAYTYTGTSTSWSITMLLRPEIDSTLLAWSQNGSGKFFAINNKFPEYYREGLYALTELTEEVADKWLVMTVRVVGTSCKLYVGKNQVASATIGIGVLLGEYLGWATSYGWLGKIAKVFVQDGALTDTQLANLSESFSHAGGIPDQVFVYTEGDSLTFGTSATGNAGWPTQLGWQRKEYRIHNAGVPGAVIADGVTRLTAAALHAPRLGGSNVYVNWLGTNNTVTGEAAATTIASYADLCTSARAAGYKVIAVTQIARNDAYAANRATVNASIRANYATYADGLCDLAFLAALSNYSDTTYYHADGVHLIDAGYAVVTKAMASAIDALDLLPDPIRLADVTATTDGVPAAIQDAIDAAAGGSVATDAIWDAAGDLVVGTGSNTAARLAIGTNGQALTSNGTTAVWSTLAGTGDALVANTLDQFANVTQTAGQTLAITSSTTLSGGTHSGTNTGDQNLSSYATTAYVDNTVVGLLDSKGPINCSANPNYPVGLKGDLYHVTVAGKIGGALGADVDVSDAIVCSADNAGGTQAGVGTSWFILEHNLNGAVLIGGALGTPSSGNLANCTFPTLNQSTTGSAASLTTARSIYGNNFNATADLTQLIASTFGGTGNGFTKFSGPTTAERTKALRDASDTIVEVGGSYTITGTWTNVTLVTPTLGSGSFTALRTTEITNTISANAVTIALGDGNHQTLTLAAATGAVTVTLTVPSSASAGTIVLLQDDTSRDITWSSAATILWAGTQPTWTADTVSSYRIVSWRYDGTRLFLLPTDIFTANS